MKKSVKVIIVSLVVLAVAVGGVTWAALWTGSTKDMVAVADKFRPPASWTLVSEKIEPPRLLCLGDNVCPSVHRNWTGPGGIRLDEFRKVLDIQGWDMTFSKGCSVSMGQSFCLVDGKSSQYRMQVSLTNGLDKSEISLNVWKSN